MGKMGRAGGVRGCKEAPDGGKREGVHLRSPATTSAVRRMFGKRAGGWNGRAAVACGGGHGWLASSDDDGTVLFPGKRLAFALPGADPAVQSAGGLQLDPTMPRARSKGVKRKSRLSFSLSRFMLSCIAIQRKPASTK